MPKLCDGHQNAENQKALPDLIGPKKQVSYKTEIIGGVPIVTQTQVNMTHMHAHKAHPKMYLIQSFRNLSNEKQQWQTVGRTLHTGFTLILSLMKVSKIYIILKNTTLATNTLLNCNLIPTVLLLYCHTTFWAEMIATILITDHLLFIILNWILVWDCWLEKLSNLKTSPWSLRNCDGYYSQLWLALGLWKIGICFF